MFILTSRVFYFLSRSLLSTLLITSQCASLLTQIAWEHCDGPPGSHSSLLFSNDAYLFAPEDDFLFRSQDGVTWEKIPTTLSVQADAFGPDILAAVYVDDQWKLKFSEDNGETWVVKDLSPEMAYTNSLAKTSAGFFAAQGSNSRLWKSVDAGDTWQQITSPVMNGRVLWVFEDSLVISNGRDLWISGPEGEFWSDLAPPVQDLGEYIHDLTILEQNIIVVCASHICYSPDFGTTWDVTEIPYSNAAYKLATTKNDIFVLSGDLYRSSDSGSSWELLIDRDSLPNLVDLEGFGTALVASTWNKGIVRLDKESGTFVESHIGFTKGALYDLAYTQNEIWVATGKGLYPYYPDQYIWGPKANLPVPEYQYEYIDANEEGWIVANAKSEPYIYLSRDKGVTWDTILPNLGPEPDFNIIHSVQLIDSTIFVFADVFLSPTTSLYASTDEGMSWTRVRSNVYQYAISEFEGSHYLTSINSIYRSNDQGLSWEVLPNLKSIIMLYPTEEYLLGVSADDNLYLWGTNDEWTKVTGELGPLMSSFHQDSYWDLFFLQDGQRVYSFWEYGIAVTQDTFKTWHFIQTIPYGASGPIGNAYLKFQDEIFYGYFGLYRTRLENLTTSVKDDIVSNGQDIRLIVYPNPVNSQLMITTSKRNTDINLVTLYSTSGQKLLEKQNLWQSEQVSLQMDNIPDGVYLLSVSTNSGVEAYKLVVRH